MNIASPVRNPSISAGGGSLLIKSVAAVTVDPDLGNLESTDILVEDGVIVAIAPDLPTSSGVEVIDGDGLLAMPGIVDTHTHIWNGVWRTLAGTDGQWSAYGELAVSMGPRFTPEDSFQAVLSGALELIASGVTTVHNWAHNINSPDHADAEVFATLASGIRSRFSYGYRWDLPRDEAMEIEDAARLRSQFTDPRLTYGVALRNDTTPDPNFSHFPELSLAPELIKAEIDAARAHSLPITMHILNEGPAQYYIDSGYAQPDLMIVHGYHWTADEWRHLAETGASISFSPHSALLGRKRLVPFGDALVTGMRTGLSFDHMNRSGNADMFRLMQLVAVNETLRTGFPPTSEQLIRVVTLGGAEVLDIQDQVGSLTVGKRADVILLDCLDPGLAPIHDLNLAITNSAGPSSVDTVIIDGVVKKRAGALVDWDVRDVSRDTASMMRRLLAEIGH